MLPMSHKKCIPLRITRSAVWILLFLTLFLTTHAQKISFKNFTIQNGLPQNTVNGICQDSDGYIWFATQVGAARYDGYEFEYFTVSRGLPDNFVNCLLAARDGAIWFGTESGLARYDGTGFRVYDTDNGLVNNRVDRLEEDLDGNIWVVTAYGLSIVTPDTIISYTEGNGLTDNSISEVFVDSKGTVHVATYPDIAITVFVDPRSPEIHRFENNAAISEIVENPKGELLYATQGDGIIIQSWKGQEKLGYTQGLTDEVVLSIMLDHQGRIWCGTYTEGIFMFENGVFKKQYSGKDFKPVITDMLEDSHQRIWFVDYQDGVWLKDASGFRNFTGEANNLVSDIVTDIMEDKYGNVWLATVSGASKYGKALFEVYDSDGILSDNNVISTFLDSKERLWIGTYGHLLNIKDGQTTIFQESRGFDEDLGIFTLSFAEDKHHNIYVGTSEGLYRYSGRSLVDMNHYWKDYKKDTEKELWFYSLLYTEDEKMWCSTDSGLFILDGDKMEVPEGAGHLVGNQVNSMVQVGERIYCATEDGVSVFSQDGRHQAHYSTSDSLSSNVCNDIVHDREGNIWVATDLGLSRISGFEDAVITRYGKEEGLTSNVVYFLEFSDSTLLWLGTEKGLYRYDLVTGAIKYYGVEDGFYPLETFRGAVTRGSGKDLWMGTVSGLVHYMPDYDLKNSVPPDMILFSPDVDSVKHRATAEGTEKVPVFPYNRNSLVFSFTGIHTSIPEQNRFLYFLEGYDDGWSAPGTDRKVSYTNLAHGDYVFRVKAMNLDGVASKEVNFAFTIKLPFWKTIWFIIFEVLAGLSLIYGIIKYRERQLVKEKRILETKVKVRTREIEEQKEEIETQRDEIAVKNQEITDSIHYAKHIQNAVLPGKIALEKALPEHFILFKPRDIVSGDFYWVEEKNDRIIVCAADCTGHGVPGAFMSMLGLTFLNEIVNKDEILKAGEILDRLRSYIINAMSHRDIQARDGMDLALVVINKQLGILEFSGAYNPMLLVRDGELIEYKGDKMPIGKHEGEELSYTSHKIELRPDDMIYLFSDGFPDQFGGPKGGKYKARPFKQFLQKISADSMEKQEARLEIELQSWLGGIEQLDDILVMGIRYNHND